jgi:proteasome lid subunit RPN8/RPN11
VIEVVLSERCVAKLRRELRRAGAREIGGVLAGENLGGGRFSVVDLSVQRNGTVASFRRSAPTHRRFIQRFLERTGHDYGRFNYLGEWHSHPSFPAWPSRPDLTQMQALVDEPDQRAHFLVLLVCKLARAGAGAGAGALEATAHAFRRGHPEVKVELAGAQPGSVLVPAARFPTIWSTCGRREAAVFRKQRN